MNLRSIVAGGSPVVVARDLSWRDRGVSNLPQLRQALWGNKVTVVHQDGPAVKWAPDRTLPESRQVPFGDFQPFGTGDYVQEDVNAIKGLRALYDPPQLPWTVLREKFWLGGAGLVTPLHFDPVETLHWVVAGEKLFSLYQPGYRGMECPGGTTPFISGLDPENLGDDQPEPLLKILLRAGEALYLPAYWWHHVRSIAPLNVSLNYVWQPSWSRRLAHPAQWLRCIPHVRRQLARVRSLQEG